MERVCFCRPSSVFRHLILARPGGDRLPRALRRSTIGAEGFHGRVRDGIGCWPLAIATRPCGDQKTEDRSQKVRSQKPEGVLASGLLISGSWYRVSSLE